MRTRPLTARLQRRVLRVLATSPLPVSTVDLALIAAPRLRFSAQRVWQVLAEAEVLRLVRRVPPLPRREPGHGRRSVFWVLTPRGQAEAGRRSGDRKGGAA